MHIGVLGLNHKLADLKLREHLASTCHKAFGLHVNRTRENSFLLLSTCNRTEIYFTSEYLTETHINILAKLRQDLGCEFEQKLYSFFGEDCFLHLSRVTSGLDSAVLAETEIQGQVKMAYEETIRNHPLSSELHYLFQKSMNIGKKVRTTLPLPRGTPQIEHAIWKEGIECFSSWKEIKVLVLGASEINHKIIHFLRNKGVQNITLCNRTEEKAYTLSEMYHLEMLQWNAIKKWVEYDCLIVATKSHQPLISSSEVDQELNSPKLIIDLGVPRNVDKALSKFQGITLRNIDDLHHRLTKTRKKSQYAINLAESIIKKETEKAISRYQRKARILLATCW